MAKGSSSGLLQWNMQPSGSTYRQRPRGASADPNLCCHSALATSACARGPSKEAKQPAPSRCSRPSMVKEASACALASG
eukprot:1761217-Pyramimonas_sp.AAC.1